jgi:hypothetical protein
MCDSQSVLRSTPTGAKYRESCNTTVHHRLRPGSCRNCGAPVRCLDIWEKNRSAIEEQSYYETLLNI